MQKCRLSIQTSVDGQISRCVRLGEMEDTETGLVLRYTEQNAGVELRLEGKKAHIRRQGDYSLDLLLVEGENTEGKLGLGGAEGGMQTHTGQVSFSVNENALEIELSYGLIFGDEVQKMHLLIKGKRENK